MFANVDDGGRKGRWIKGIPALALGALLMVSMGIPCLAYSQSDDEKPAEGTVDDVMSRLVKISKHGDLKDDKFFGDVMGIKMIGFLAKEAPISFYACGVSPERVGTAIKYQYVEVPWFLGGADKGKKPCEYGYLKEINSAGEVVSAVARLNILPNKVCITKSEVDGYFKGAALERHPESQAELFDFYGKNGIKLTLMFSLNRAYRSCVDLVMIRQ